MTLDRSAATEAGAGAGNHPGFEQHMKRGRLELSEGAFDAAARSFGQAVTHAQAQGDFTAELDAVNMQARSISALGQPQRALAILERTLSTPPAGAPPDKLAIMRSNAGEMQRVLANYPAALENLKAAQAHFDTNRHLRRPSAVNLINIGLLHQDMGRQAEARQYLLRAQEDGLAIGDRMVVAVTLNNLANTDMSTGDYFVAAERFRGALAQARELEQPEYQIDNLDGLGLALAALGDYEQAREVHAEAYELARSIGDRPGEMELLINLGRDSQRLGRHRAAIASFEEALALAEELDRPRIRTELHGLLSEAFEAAGDPWAALRHARTQLQLTVDMFASSEDQPSASAQ